MASKERKAHLAKIGLVKLTQEQRELIAANMDSDFFKLIRDVILPSRVTQIAVTAISTAQDDQDLYFFKGRTAEAGWLSSYLKKQSENIDDTSFDNQDDDIDATDDDPSI